MGTQIIRDFSDSLSPISDFLTLDLTLGDLIGLVLGLDCDLEL